MPKEGISIYFTMKDGASSVLSSIGDKTKALDKETQQLAQATTALANANKNLLTRQTSLKNEISEASKKVKETQKAYNEYGDELSKSYLDDAVKQHASLQEKMIEVNAQIRANQKTYNEYTETLRKSGSAETASISSLTKGLAAGQVGQMAASSIGGFLSQELSSAIGVPTAAAISDSLSGAISGATAGAVAGLPGIIIGGLVGAGSGALSGITEIKEAKDDAFKEYYAGLYEDVNAATEGSISSGSTTAGSREQTLMAFAKRLGGTGAATAYLEDVESFAAQTNYGYDEITGYAKLLMNTYESGEVFGVLQSLSDATAGLSLNSSDVQIMIQGLSRMRTTGKATQEYLNYFSERGVDVYDALGSALGVDKSAIAGMVTDGDITGGVAAEAILDYIDKTYGGLSEDLMSTYDAMADNLSDIMTSIDAAAGEGYNETRKSGLQAETDAYSGALGEAMEELGRISGENQAYMENLSEQYLREAREAVLLGAETSGIFTAEQEEQLAALREDYLAASEAYARGEELAGLNMEVAAENAAALATAAYESSDQYQKLRDTELDQIEAIREYTEGLSAATAAYEKSVEMSKGLGSVTRSGTTENGDVVTQVNGKTFVYSGGYAYGLDRVPYDNYPALLHEGERVLTAAEARSMDSSAGQTIQITITGNNFTGGAEDMADQLAELLADRLEKAAAIAVPR